MNTRILLIVLCIISVGMGVEAQNVKRPESYNYRRGVEACQNRQYKDALEYLNKELEENPKNGYAFSWIASIREYSEEYGRALTASNLALKYLPKKDVDYVVFAYSIRAKVYLALEDTIKALDDFSQIIRLQPKETRGYESRAQLYYEMEKYDLSDADYRKMTELAPGETMGYMGLARNANMQKRWNESIQLCSSVIKLADVYSSGYAFRAEAYIGRKMWNEATDDLVKALSLDFDRKALGLLTELKDEDATDMLIAKMRVQMAKSPNETNWPIALSILYKDRKDYRKAIECYEKANHINASAFLYRQIASEYAKLGEYDNALKNIDMAINMDSTEIRNLYNKANYLYEKGDTEAGIKMWDKVLEQEPDLAWGYYRRGWFKEIAGDNEAALEDLNMSIILDPKYAYAYETRGRVNQMLGREEKAKADFKKVIELETKPEDYNCIFYAYHGLGQDDKAVETFEAYLANDSTSEGNYYDGACLYSLMQDKVKALYYLEECLKRGYARFAHLERDCDLDFIRDTEEYKALIEKYRKVATEKSSTSEKNGMGEEITIAEIPFTKEGGVCQVKCKINDLPLYFVFDTGASTVSLSMVEANFMVKNGYLKEKDVIGSQHFVDANGNVSEGTIVNLREVDFGGERLSNVRASVVRNQQAPLLLGQSVLGRLGKIEIDNQNCMLKIKK